MHNRLICKICNKPINAAKGYYLIDEGGICPKCYKSDDTAFITKHPKVRNFYGETCKVYLIGLGFDRNSV